MDKTFVDSIESLNFSMPSFAMVSLPIGRGYLTDDDEYTDAPVRVRRLRQCTQTQRGLVQEFAAQSSGTDQTELYIGIGGEINLSYIAALKPQAAILIDINPMQTVFWQHVISDMKGNASILNFKDRVSTIERRMAQHLRDKFSQSGSDRTRHIEGYISGERLTRSPRSIRQIMEEDLSGQFWMSEAGYSALHDLACHDNFAALTLSIGDVEGCTQLADTLNQLGLRANYVHTSKVLKPMSDSENHIPQFSSHAGIIQNIKTLSKSSQGTRVITDTACLKLPDAENLYL